MKRRRNAADVPLGLLDHTWCHKHFDVRQEAVWYSYFLALRKKIGDLGRQHQRTAVVTPYELDNHLGRLLWQVFL
jgi:hypothetical protein